MRRKNVLIVDDDAGMTRLFSRLLASDCEVREVGGICEALAVLDACRPDVVVIDPAMDGGGGKYLLAAMADHYPAVQRLVYSAMPLFHLLGLVDAGLAHAAVSKSEQWLVLANEVRRLATAGIPQDSKTLLQVVR